MPEPTVILGELAEDFTAKIRNGHVPDIESYATQHPELADRIRELFPALMLLEGLAAEPTGATVDERTNDPSASLPSGTIFGQYRIEREIARGGMGIVYEAEHLTLHRQVALKVLPMSGPQAAKQLERFLREAKTAAGLHHTNIVPVFDVGQVRGVPYYAMQYINGQSLDQSIKASRPLTGGGETPTHFRHVADVGTQAAAGLTHAHQRGVIHRDIKPSNLLLDDQGVVWITDFGLARRHDDVSLTHSGQIIGTPRYMSPEQAAAAAQPLDHRTDIYSLGVTLYELLTRRPAFDGLTPQDVVKQIIAREPIRPRQLDPHVPRDLETIVLKAMAKRPEDRYPTAQALADDLQRFTHGEPIQARRIGIVGRTWRWAKREPVVAGLVGAVAAAFVIGLTGTTWFAIQSRRKSNELTGVLYEAAAGMTRLEDEKGEPFKALLWLCEPAKAFGVPRFDEQLWRTSISVFLRYCPVVRRDGRNITRETVAHPLILEHVGSTTESDWFPTIIDGTAYLLTPIMRGEGKGTLPDGYKLPERFVRGPACKLQSGEIVGKLTGHRIRSYMDGEWESLERSNGVAKSDRYMVKLERNWLEWQLVSRDGIISPTADTLVPGYVNDIATPIDHSASSASDNALFEVIQVIHGSERTIHLVLYDLTPMQAHAEDLITLATLLACMQLDRGRYSPLSLNEARSRWAVLQSKYPDVFTVPIDDLLAWHLKDDEASIKQKHRHAALFAANFDCRDRPNDPHPFVARGRLFTVLGEWDKAEADFAKAWQLGGTGWVKSECRRLGRDALNEAKQEKAERQSLETAVEKAEIAGKYLPPIGPHRWARLFARHRLRLKVDVKDQATMSWVLCWLPVAG